jgi:hypothetical protein
MYWRGVASANYGPLAKLGRLFQSLLMPTQAANFNRSWGGRFAGEPTAASAWNSARVLIFDTTVKSARHGVAKTACIGTGNRTGPAVRTILFGAIRITAHPTWTLLLSV